MRTLRLLALSACLSALAATTSSAAVAAVDDPASEARTRITALAAKVALEDAAWATATRTGGGELSAASSASVGDPTFDNPSGFDARGDLTSAAVAYSSTGVAMSAAVRTYASPYSFDWEVRDTTLLHLLEVNGDAEPDYFVGLLNVSGEYLGVVTTATSTPVCTFNPTTSSSARSYTGTFAPSCIGSPASFRWLTYLVYETASSTSEDLAPDSSLAGPVTPDTQPPVPTCTAPAATSNPAVAVRRAGYWYVKNTLSGGNADGCFPFGTASDQPLYGDWDGDGFKTPGVFRSSSGQFFLSNSQRAASLSHSFSMGSPGDVAVVGDWNDDGVDGVGLFRPSTGTWYLSNRLSSGPAEGAFRYGSPGDVPVVGDWNRDGTDTLGVFRPGNGTWYLTNFFDRGTAEGTFGFGSRGDRPLNRS